ncbi:MAG: M28 family peptidase [Solirubrobacteraceae bacterium]
MPPDPYPSLDSDELVRHVEALCAIGNRYVGTAGEREAQEYVLQHFNAVGLDHIRQEALDVRTYNGLSATCEVPEWEFQLDAAGLQGTASGELEAEAVFLGGGESPAELFSDERRLPDLHGKIAVFQSFWPWELTDALLERGVAGLVLISDVPENLIAHLPAHWYGSLGRPADETLAPVPGIVVGAHTGRSLVRALANGAKRIRLTHEATYRETATANLIGEIESRGSGSGRALLLAGHHDTFIAGPGAHDNATGLAALLAIATAWERAGNRARDRQHVIFASFAAEELGLVGSGEYCRVHADELDDLIAMINFDALAWRVHGPRCLVVSDAFRARAIATLTEFGWEPDEVWDASTAASDITPFHAAGVPVAWCWRFPPQNPYFASTRDTTELLDLELVTETADAAAYLAYSLAS